MKTKVSLLSAVLAAVLVSCNHTARQASAINGSVQDICTASLKSGMKTFHATEGNVMVMDVKTGLVEANVGLTTEDGGKTFTVIENSTVASPSGLFSMVSLLADAEKTGVMDTTLTVDTGNGIAVIGGDTLLDHNWRRGGYQVINMRWGVMLNSQIYIAKHTLRVFPDEKDYDAQLRRMSVNVKRDKDTSYPKYTVGYGKCSPVQLLTFYNALANGGRMMKPLTSKQTPVVLNRQIAKPENVSMMNALLALCVKDGLGKKAYSNQVTIAGKPGTMILDASSVSTVSDTHLYNLQFCGFFPAEQPRYTLIVTLYKKGTPASGGLMAGSIAKDVAERLTAR